MVTIRRACVMCVVLSLTVIAALPAADDHDAEVAQKYLDIALHWSQYAKLGQQHSAEAVINALIDARQMRFYVTFIENHLRREKKKDEAKLAKERQWDYDRNSGGPDVVVGPDMATLREMQRRKIRDLERTIAAYDAVLDCMDPGDDRCVEVREIERQRAQWLANGDPLPQNPDIPDTSEMRTMLQRALDRHWKMVMRYREEVQQLLNAANKLADAHVTYEDRLRDLQTYRKTVDAITSELEARRAKCQRVCGEADLSARSVRQSAAEATWAANECEQKMSAAAALAKTCRTSGDADRIEALVRDAETARSTVASKIKEAEDSSRDLNKWLRQHARERDVSAIHQRLEAEHSLSNDIGGKIIDQLVEIKRGFADTDAAHADVNTIVKKLASLDFLDHEVASWEKALSDDPATLKIMRQRFADLHSEYQAVHTSAVNALKDADTVLGAVGAPESVESESTRESDRIRAAEEKARNVDIPDCTVGTIDLTTLIPDVKKVQGLLGPAAALRKAANDCRTGIPPGTGPGSSLPTNQPSGTTPPSPSTAPATTGPNSDVYGGLVIVGLPQPATITVGQSVRLQGQDHGGRPYSGVEWVTSNEQVLLVGRDGAIVGEQPGEAMVLAKFEGMRAWLDVTVVDPGGSQPASASPPGPNAGSSGAGATGTSGSGTGVSPPGGTAPAATGAATTGGAPGSTGSDQAADEGFDFGDGGSGTVEIEPSEDGLLGVSPTVDTGAASAPSSQPGSIGLLGQSTAVDGGSAPPPEPAEPAVPTAPGGFQTYNGEPYQPSEGFGNTSPPTAQPESQPFTGDALSFQTLDGSPNTLPPAAPAQPTGPTQADIVRALQQVDCSWLPGGVPAYDGNTGQIGCTCPDGTQLATDRPACIDCVGPQRAFMNAVQSQNYQLAQQALNAAQGCQWAPGAQAQLRDLVCTQAEMAVLQALQSRGPAAAQNAIRAANGQGCRISPQTSQLVASASRPPSAGTRPPQRPGPSATEMMQMFNAVTQSLIAMQGGTPTPSSTPNRPGATAFAPSRPGGGSRSNAPTSSGHSGSASSPAAQEQCARNLCVQECANAIGLLTEGTTERCDRCLKRRRPECAGSGSSGSSSSSSGSRSTSSSGSGAWANPQWTMPTGEGGGRCYAGKSWTRPYRYAIACDSNDGTAHYKLTVGGHPSIVYGPASFTDCQRYLAQLTGGQ